MGSWPSLWGAPRITICRFFLLDLSFSPEMSSPVSKSGFQNLRAHWGRGLGSAQSLCLFFHFILLLFSLRPHCPSSLKPCGP